MSITRVPAATAGTVPAGGTDYQAQNDLLFAHGLALMGTSPVDFTNTRIPQGAAFNIGGVWYRCTANESITGTPSKYVKVTPAGATASAAFVANLTGVTWSVTYNGYYDGSGNLYLFDEARAVYDGAVTAPKTVIGKMAYAGAMSIKGLTVTGSLMVSNGVSADFFSGGLSFLGSQGPSGNGLGLIVRNIGAWNMDGTASVDVSLSISAQTDYSDIMSIEAFILDDTKANLYPISYSPGAGNVAGYAFLTTPAAPKATLTRVTSGFFDNTTFNDGVMNRGFVIVRYRN